MSLLRNLREKQGIFEIEDGDFIEDEQTHEIVRERCPNISPQKCFGCSGKHHFDFQRETAYARMRMNTSQSKSCVSSHPLPSFHPLSRNHPPESGQGDDEATGKTKPSQEYFSGSGHIAACNHAFST